MMKCYMMGPHRIGDLEYERDANGGVEDVEVGKPCSRVFYIDSTPVSGFTWV